MTTEAQGGGARVAACRVSELLPGQQKEVCVGGLSVVLINDGGQFYALRNLCSHRDYPLLGGEVSQGRITCEKHGGKFDLTTGKAKVLPAVKPVAVYRTHVEGETVYVEAL